MHIVEQKYKYDCGAAILQSILISKGITVDYKDVITIAKTSRKIGTTVDNFINALDYFNIRHCEGVMDKDELVSFFPTVILIQCDRNTRSWYDSWDFGHYVICLDADNKYIYYGDPKYGDICSLKHDQLEKRWHDIDHNGNVYENFGINIW